MDKLRVQHAALPLRVRRLGNQTQFHAAKRGELQKLFKSERMVDGKMQAQ